MPKNNVELICSIGELAPAFERSASLPDFLQKVVTAVAEHMNATVCSVYLYDEAAEELVLRATYGLDSSAIDNVRLGLEEGITGRAMKELRPIRVDRGDKSPFFKHVPGIHEEEHQAFVAVPILRGLSRVGVLVIQHREAGYFDAEDVRALQAIASQLAGTIENARLFMTLRNAQGGTVSRPELEAEGGRPTFIKGKGGAPGVGLGPVKNLEGVFAAALDKKWPVSHAPDHSLRDFEDAVHRTSEQLELLQQQMEELQADVSAALVFSAHLLMLMDVEFVGRMRKEIEGGIPPAEAIVRTVRYYVDVFSSSPMPQFQEKVQDIRDLGHRLLANLLNDGDEGAEKTKGHVVIARDVLPSELVKLKAEQAAGIVLTGGGVTAHVAILARSLDIPLVVHDGRLPFGGEPVSRLLIDGSQGHIFVDPEAEVLSNYEALLHPPDARPDEAGPGPCQTRTADGHTVCILANINLLSELSLADRAGADGVGLYRSEFPYMIRSTFPSEEEQYRIYSRILKEMSGRPVTFRTLDIGGDKALSYFSAGKEENPFLGLRAIRFSLRYRDIFADQLRALLRAGARHELRIMFPMVGSLDDFDTACSLVRQCIRDLAHEGREHNAQPLLGIMLEIPAAVELAEEFAAEVDFVSVGSNDLTQYILAADRTNQRMAEYYCTYHPAVLRSLNRIAQAVQRYGKSLSICGEMAHDPKLLPFLLGIGMRTFSMDPRLIRTMRKAIATMRVDSAEPFASTALGLGRLDELAAHFGA